MTMGQIGATSKRGVNRQAFSPEVGRAHQLLVAWTWEASFTLSIDAVGNLYMRGLGSVPTAAPELSTTMMYTQMLKRRGKGVSSPIDRPCAADAAALRLPQWPP
jgi:hypothetical protein